MFIALRDLRTAPAATSTDCDPLSFLDNCRRGLVSKDDFARHGPVMAMRWIFTQDLAARTAR